MQLFELFIEKITRSSNDKFYRKLSATIWFCSLPGSHG
jgi:hypothetical protein